MQASGLLVVSPTLAESQVSMTIDDTGLQALLSLRKVKVGNFTRNIALICCLNLSLFYPVVAFMLIVVAG